MNPSYCRILVAKDAALHRFAQWNKLSQVGPLIPAKSGDAVRLACDEAGNWRGRAVFVLEIGKWTLFQDLFGALSAIPGVNWLGFARDNDLIFAGYNDAINYGELVVVSKGVVLREFLYDRDSPEANIDIGQLDDPHEPFETWVEVAGFVDDDRLGFSEGGWLWLY
jgi:hypothetical protein